MVNLGLIITNEKYDNEDLEDLPNVPEDAKMMTEMLNSHNYEIELYSDVEDIGNQLEKFRRNVTGREIDRLHFHFSGHGVHNARIQLEADELEKMKERGQSDTKTTQTPVGECLVGTAEKLYAVHDLKRKLLECGSNKITITLDCCRDPLRGTKRRRQSVKLKERKRLTIAEQEKIGVISGALDLHRIWDNCSLTRELNEVTDAGKAPILFTDIAKKVNASWKKKGIEQRSERTLLEDEENWADYMWPTSVRIGKGESANSLSKQTCLQKSMPVGERLERLEARMEESERRTQARFEELIKQKADVEQKKGDSSED